MSMHFQVAVDVSATRGALIAAVQGPVTRAALVEGLDTEKPAWTTLPSRSQFGELGAPVVKFSHWLRSEFARLRVASARAIEVLRSAEVALPGVTMSSVELHLPPRDLAHGTDFPHLSRTWLATVLASRGGRR